MTQIKKDSFPLFLNCFHTALVQFAEYKACCYCVVDILLGIYSNSITQNVVYFQESVNFQMESIYMYT